MANLITDTAQLACNQGTTPSNLLVTSQDFITIEDKPIATEQDVKPNVNIKPFGQCKLKPSSAGYLPCVPAPQKWDKIAQKQVINDNAMLTDESFCMCSVGGKISVKDKGHSQVHIIDDEPIENHRQNEEQGSASENEEQDNKSAPSISNAVVYFRKCKDYMNLTRDERRGKAEPDTSKIYGFDEMLDSYNDIYGYYWEGKTEEEEVKTKIINTKDPSSKFSNLEDEYNPSIIEWKKAKNNKNKYYVPWLSIHIGQKIRLQIQMDWKNKPQKLEWDKGCLYSEALKLPNLSQLSIQKGLQTLGIECIGDIKEEIEIRILADGKVAGRLQLVPNKKRKLKITWCLVDLSGKDKKGRYTDIEALKDKLTQQEINRFVKYLGLSQALIDIEATSTYKELHLSDLGYTWEKYIKLQGYKYDGDSIVNRNDLQDDCKKQYEKKYSSDDNMVVMFLINKRHPRIKIDRKDKIVTEVENQYVGGNAFDLGSKYLMLYKGFDDNTKTVTHEILHCLSLQHTFSKKEFHKFKAYETDNFMDYVFKDEADNRKTLHKWQWLKIWEYLDKVLKLVIILISLVFVTSCKTSKICTQKISYENYLLSYNYDDYVFFSSRDCFKREIEVVSDMFHIETNYDVFRNNLYVAIVYSDRRKVSDEKYLFKEMYYKKGNKQKRFSDKHINYFQYHTFETVDTLMAGRLLESYQKYDNVLIGTHTWYKYDREKATKERINYCKEFTKYDVSIEISKQVNYDTIYPICWSKAIKLAKKKGIRGKYPNLEAPHGYPNEKQTQENAFWIVSDNRKTVKINAYTGKNDFISSEMK